MLHNLFYTLCLMIIMTIQTIAQQNWVPFLQQTKTKPTINLTASNSGAVSFTVQINGMETSHRKVDVSAYQKLSIPDGEFMTQEGSPQMPMITKLIAIPDCGDVSISISHSNELHFANYNVLPAPRYEKKKGGDELTEVFEENKSVYSSNADFPGKYGEIIETGYVRGQKVARVAIYPIQFNPVSKKIKASTNFNISLSFSSPASPVNKELGIFRNMMHHAALNYEPDGINASTKISKATEGNQLNKTLQVNGSVTRVTNLSTLVGTNAIPVDYLIITHSSLFNSNSLTTLANHRRDYNGYDVVIVKVEDIYADTRFTSSLTWVDIRDFVRDVYLYGQANHTGDEHLGYILLAGDALQDNNSTVMVPAAYPTGTTPEYGIYEQGSDYYYTCTGGDNDNLQDVMYGRLSVGNETELSNVVNKINSYEANTGGNWNSKSTFVSFSPDLYTYADPAIEQMTETIPSSYQKSYAYRNYTTSAQTVVTEANPIFGQSFTTAQYADANALCGYNTLNDWIYDNTYAGINSGIHTFIYEGHGGWNALGANEGCGRRIFYVNDGNCSDPSNTNSISNRLNNSLYSFMIFNCCDAGHLDHTSGDCVAEAVVNLASKGAIGVLASSRDSYAGGFGTVDRYLLEAQYNHLSHIMGEAVMESKLNLGSMYKRQYNLYGDPAVNLWPTGYTVSENITLSGNNTISENLTVASGITLTISAGSNLRFTNGASLTVNGTLIVNGTSTNKITFDFISPNSSTQNGIKVNTGASLYVSNAIIKYAWYGIYCNNTSSSPISNWEIMYCNTGIYFSSTNVGISNNYIHENSIGIALYNSSPTLTLNKLTGNSNYAVSSSGSTAIPLFGTSSTQGKNFISSNSVGVCAFSSSLPMLGNNSPINGGYNRVGDNTNYNIYAITSGVLYAANNYWAPTPSKAYIYNGTIVSSPYLSSDPTGLGKSVPLTEDAVLAMLSKAMGLIEQKDFTAAREICLDIVNNYSDSYAAYNALGLLTQTYDLNEKETTKLIYKTFFNKAGKKLNAVAGLILAELDKGNKLKIVDEVISKFNDDAILEDALFAKFIYYLNDVQDNENARLISNELDKLFPNSLTAFDAHSQLGDKDYLGKEYPFAKLDQKQNIVSSSLPTEYDLFANYPNPFNPVTIIKYALPYASNVNVTVYNTLGQIVKAFIEGTKETGYHNINFNGEELSSGVYLYTINAVSVDGKQNFQATKKMMLVK